MIKIALFRIYLYFFFFFKEKYLFKKDKFGLKYFIWKDTRPLDTLVKKVRIDDTSLIFFIIKSITFFNKSKRKKYFFDVGSYIGIVSLIFNKYSNNCEIHSFEAFKKTFFRLCENLRLNKCQNILANNFPISDCKEHLFIQICNQDFGMNKTVKINSNSLVSENEQSILSKRLDQYCIEKKINYIDILKIDAEGYDLKVLIGCGKFLKKQAIKLIVVEFLSKDEKSIKIRKYLQSCNYELFYLVRNQDLIVWSTINYPKDASSLLNAIALPKNSPLKKLLIR